MGLLEMTFVGYLVVLLGIGGYFFWTREHRDLLDYMLADRDIEFVPMALSEGASVASGWTFFAWVAFGFETGLNGLLFSFFFLVMVVILYLVVGGPFRRQSEAHQSLTITDHLASFFSGYTGILIRWVGTLAIIVFFGAYVGSQLSRWEKRSM